jgi:hypothetical protein
MRRLAEPRVIAPPIVSGPSGACGAAALEALCSSPDLAAIRQAAGVTRKTVALVVITEGL